MLSAMSMSGTSRGMGNMMRSVKICSGARGSGFVCSWVVAYCIHEQCEHGDCDMQKSIPGESKYCIHEEGKHSACDVVFNESVPLSFTIRLKQHIECSTSLHLFAVNTR